MRKLFDMHTHSYTPEALDFMRSYLDASGLEGLAIASFGCDGDGCVADQNILPLLFKRLEPRIWAYGSLIYPCTPAGALEGHWKPENQAKELLDMGFDGIKILETKPDSRKLVGLPLDGEEYEAFFAFLEAQGTPVLWHVADPHEFWDVEKAPDFAVKAGWTYDESFLSWDEIMAEVMNVLHRHPRLRAILAHFFFHSFSVQRARQVMDECPGVFFDLTPGIEMYVNFSSDRDAWREFFIRNCRRLMFGTDADEFCADIMCDDEKDPSITVRHMRRFLETDDEFAFWGRSVKGLKLPDGVLDRIYFDNFRELFPHRKTVDEKLLAEYIGRHSGHICREENRAWIPTQKIG